MMKKLIALFLAALMCLSLCACGKDSTDDETRSAGKNETEAEPSESVVTESTEPEVDYSAYLKFELNEDEESYTVSGYSTGYRGPSPELVIPSEYEGLPVTVVNDLHLSSSDVERVVLPDTVTELGSYAMCNSKVSSVVFSKNLEVIGDCAFSNCTNLTEIQLPEGLRSIGGSAFTGTGLTTLVLPSTVEEMGTDAFGELEYLTEATITCAGGRAFKECPALKKVTVIQGAGTSIGSKAFYGCDALESVVFLGDNITHIYGDAFYRCTVLETVTLPSKLEFIGNGAFNACYALQTLEIPDSVTKIEHEALMTDAFGEPNGTIICSAGSYAEKYATQNGYQVETK